MKSTLNFISIQFVGSIFKQVVVFLVATIASNMMDSNSVSSDKPDGVVVFSPSEMRIKGLLLVNYTLRPTKRARTKRNNERFAGHFGASPAVICKILEDLQTTTITSAQVPPQDVNL